MRPLGLAGFRLHLVLCALALLAAAPIGARQQSGVPSDAAGQALDRARAESLCADGEAQFARAQYAPAGDLGQQCAEIFDRLGIQSGIGRANLLLASVANVSGDQPESEIRARRALAAYEAAGDTRGRAVATLQIVRVARLDRGEDLRLLEQAISDARAIRDRSLEGRGLHSLGDHLFTAANYEDAHEALTQAAAAFEAIGDRRALGRVYNSVGRLYRAHKQTDEALKYQLQALAIHETTNSPFELLQSLNAVAVTYQSLGQSANARKYFERALAAAEGGSSPRIQDFLRANLVGTLIEEGVYADAARILEGVLARGLDAYPGNRMAQLAGVYLKLGRLVEATALAEKAVAACTSRDLDCLYALDRRAEVHAAAGRRDAALADVTAALQKVEEIRTRLVPADFFKQQFSGAQDVIYSRAIALQLKDGQAAGALATAELARSRAFVDLLASKALGPRESTGGRTGPDPIGDLPLVFRGSATERPRGPRGDLTSDVAAPAATTADLIAEAKRLGSTLLAYWVTDDRLFIWVVRLDGQVRTAAVDVRQSQLAELIRAASPFAANDPGSSSTGSSRAQTTRGGTGLAPAAAEASWRKLYDLLVKPVRADLPRQPGSLLTVVPHGPLSALSFAALQDGQGRYLLEDYTLHYVPSGAVLTFTSSRRRPAARAGDLLLVADPVPPAPSKLERTLPRLAGARAEARAIARLVPAARVTTLAGQSATKAAIRTASAGKAVVHFATHAIVNDEDPFASFLAVTPAGSRQEPTDDGLLTAREIYELDLDADLIVLSACRSAGGRVSGDGIATFARAFIYAGTPSLVASAWDVADDPTNRLLPEFYRAWLSGATKARALRTAQLTLLRQLRAGKVQVDTPLGKVLLPEHPVFWAGFMMFGEP